MKEIKKTRGDAAKQMEDKIRIAAQGLFYKFGVRKTTVEDICHAAEISRMTFYKHYRDKLHTAEAVINRLSNEMVGSFLGIMRRDVCYRERIREFIELKLARTNDMSAAFIREILASPYTELHAVLRRQLDENLALAVTEFREAQKAGHIRPDIKPEFLIAFMNVMTDLVVDERLSRLFPTPGELVAELMNLFFYGILNGERVN